MLTNFMWLKQQKKWMTLIELLVVIFVLWVWILSITILITKNLSLTKNIHNQNSATILAREGIEMIYNIKNTNKILWYKWNCAIKDNNPNSQNEDFCLEYMFTGWESNHKFIVDWAFRDNIILSWIDWSDFNDLFEKSRLYLTWATRNWVNITWYTHIPNSNPTPFARYISFTGVQGISSDSPIKTNDIHHISSTVLYKISENTTWSITLESFITNYE